MKRPGSNLVSVTSVEVADREAKTIRRLLEDSPSEGAFRRASPYYYD